MEYFGVNVRPTKKGLKLKREDYAIIDPKNSFKKNIISGMRNIYTDEEQKFYKEEWCLTHREKCLKNFDLNMAFFKTLDHDEFDREINKFLKKYKKFKEVYDLKEYNNVSGYYIMVLDNYCQIYVGTSENIKRRIQSHWTKNKNFDRLLYPMNAVETSVLSIDSFCALDTTRIYALRTTQLYDSENKYIEFFSPKFITNRIGGGKIEPGVLGYLQIITSIKSKALKSEEK